MNPIEKDSTEQIKFVPEVVFNIADTKSQTELFYLFLKESGNKRWISVFEKSFPDLVKALEGITDKKQALDVCNNFVEAEHNKQQAKMLQAKDEFESEWKKIVDPFLLALSDHMETDWPEDKKEVVGSISVLPVYPRYLDKYTFFVGYKNIHRMIETSAHEIVHFLWFKKWKEVFPEHDKKEYESPNLAWRLSEIIDPIILQSHPKIKELVKPDSWGYSSFKDIKIGDIGMVEYFRKIYEDSVTAGNSFDVTMRLLWEEAQKHEKEIGGF